MKKILLLICVVCVSSAFAQQSELLDRYRSMALDYNYDLKAAERNISASIELEKAVRADLKPKLSGDASFQYTGNPTKLTLNLPTMDNPFSFEGCDMKYGASLTLLQPVYTGGRILESIRLAKHQYSLATNQVEMLRSAVYYQTDVQYWNTVARVEVVGVVQEYRDAIASLVKTIRERVEVGLVDPQDLLMAEVKLNEAEYAFMQAKNNLKNGCMALNSLIGVTLEGDTEIEQTIPPVVLDGRLLQADGTDRPELKIASDRILIVESTGKLSDSKYKPQLYVGVDGSYSSPGYNFKSDMNPNYAAYAKVSIPLFEWGKRKNEKRAYAYRTDMEKDNLSKVTDQVNLEVQTARVSLAQAVEQVRLAGSSLGKAQENEQKAVERYNEGKVSVIEVIEAQTYRQTSQLNYVQAKATSQGAYAELLRVLNQY